MGISPLGDGQIRPLEKEPKKRTGLQNTDVRDAQVSGQYLSPAHLFRFGKLITMNKPLTSWQKTLRTLGFKVNWKAVHSKKRRRVKQQDFHFASLEPRKMLASVSFDNGHLEVTGTEGDDVIAITVSANNELTVLANDEVVEGLPATVLPSDVESIFVGGLDGNDRIDLSAVSPDTFTSITERIAVSSGFGDDTIFGSAFADDLVGGSGDDAIYAGDGNDQIFGNAGNDFLVGGDGIVGDVNRNGEVDFFDISPFISLLVSDEYQFEADVNQDGRFDFFDISPFISLLSNNSQTPVGDADDGNDALNSGLGVDTLQGGTGDDVYTFRNQDLGLNTVLEFPGEGHDVLDFISFGSGVTIDLSSATTVPVDEDGLLSFPAFQGQEIEQIFGTIHGDVLSGNELDNVIHGIFGDDTLFGGGGNDLLDGGVGDDILDGGSGSDDIFGRAGADTLVDGGQDLSLDLLNGGEGIDSPEVGFSVGATRSPLRRLV